MRRCIDHLARLPQWVWLLLVSVLAISARVAWAFALVDRQPRVDEVAYLDHAARLCAGAGYVNNAGVPDNYWPVGFPAVLAAVSCAFGHLQVAGIGLQITLGTLTCVLISLLGERLFGAAVGRLGSLVVALYPTHVFYATLMLTEPLAALLIVAAGTVVLCDVRAGPGTALAVGVLVGLAILVRPVLLAVPAVLLAWHAANGIRARRAAWLATLSACAALGVLSPWLARNHRVLGTWTEVSSTGGYIFLLGNNPTALGGYLGDPGLLRQLVEGDRIDGSRGYRLGWETIRSAPLTAIRRVPQKLSYFFALETDGALWNLKGLPPPVPLAVTLSLLALANLAYLLVWSGSLLALTSPAPNWPFASFFVLLGAYLAIMAAIFSGDPRYHYPLIPFAALLFGRACLVDGPQLVAGIQAGDPQARRRLTRWMALNAVFVALMLLNLWLKHLESQRFGQDALRPFVG